MDPAFDEWREAIGALHVRTDGGSLQRAGEATFATTQQYAAILEPANHAEAVQCIRIAHRHRVPLYAVSTGCNWGYGSRVAVRDGSVLLSLARLNRIVDYDEALAYVTIEPGVTFRCLSRFLEERGSPLIAPSIGSSPDASLIGNIMERGIGKGFYENLPERSCAYRIILADGETIETGTALRRHSAGPAMEGLFQQSNLGVVTRVTLWLEPAPRLRQRAVLLMRSEDEFARAVDTLRPLLQRSGAPHVEIVNDYRVLSQSGQFPYTEHDGLAALPREYVREKLRHLEGAQWIGSVMVWGDSEAELVARRATLATRLADIRHVWEAAAPGREPVESYIGLRSAYWRKRTPMPSDPHPDRDRCGVLWVAPAVPMLGETAVRVLHRIEWLMVAHGFEPGISIRCIGGRTMQALAGLFWDRDEPGADERAVRCHDALRAMLDDEGRTPYRLSIREMPAASTNPMLEKVKRTLDPHGILASGRYIP